MAPSPEHDNEPKAPDKNDNSNEKVPEDKTTMETRTDLSTSAKDFDLQESSVLTLDDYQLKALLDEAINYKTPKDKEGKSPLFQELLQEAEEDERNARAASASGSQLARYYNTTAARRHRNSTSRREANSAAARSTHGGSLQNLAKPELYVDVPSGTGTGRRTSNNRRRHHHGATVSARQREGGSLPSNVNAGAAYERQLLVDDASRPNRTRKSSDKQQELQKMVEVSEAIVVQPKPEYTVVELGAVDGEADADETRALLGHDYHAISYSSTMTMEARNEQFMANCADDNAGRRQHSLEEQTHRTSRLSYTSRATLEVDDITNTASSTPVDKGIMISQLARTVHDGAGLQLESEYDSVSCIVEQSKSKLPLSKFRFNDYLRNMSAKVDSQEEGQTHSDNNKKGLDENGNSVNAASTPPLSDTKRKKKSKVDRKVTVLKSEQIVGYRGNTNNIDLLVKYIEEGDAATSSMKNKHHVSSKNNYHQQQNNSKRTRVKSKSDDVVKKSNSLEEISRSKLEDLMAEDMAKCVRTRVKKQSTSEDGDRRSWGTEDGQQYICGKSSDPDGLETEFHVVTKKKKSKKRHSDHVQNAHNPQYSQADYYHQTRAHRREKETLPARRKSTCSMPPSDKSNESSDDLDSVHSLPVRSVRRNDIPSAQAQQTLISYADIARTNGGTAGVVTNYVGNNLGNYGGHTQPQMSPSAVSLRSDNFPDLCDPTSDFPSLEPLSLTAPVTPMAPRAATPPPPTRSKPAAPTRPQPDFKCCDTSSRVRRSTASTLPRRATSRPAVIILDGDVDDDLNTNRKGPIQVSGLTFGFELNEQLLNNCYGAEKCAVSAGELDNGGADAATQTVTDIFSARFLAPIANSTVTSAYNHDKIVTFVGLAWEDIMHQSNGKVQYYNGQ